MNEDAPLLEYDQQGWTQFKADLMRVVKEKNPSNNWESKEYSRGTRKKTSTRYPPYYREIPIKRDISYEKNQKFKLSQDLLFDVYLHGCKPDSMTVKPYGKTGLLIETSESEIDLCEGNIELKEIQRRCRREREFNEKPSPRFNRNVNWNKQYRMRQQIRNEYVGGRITNKMREELQKRELKMAPPQAVHVDVDLKKKIVTTWYSKDKIGDVVKQGSLYLSNWGDARVNITAIIYGVKYTGTYFVNTGYSTLRRQMCNDFTMHLLPACKDGFYRDWKHDGICVAIVREESC